MPIASDPTNLDIYYCENCHGIIATTDIDMINALSSIHCPFCLEDSLVKLATEDFADNFNSELFPHPQDIILEKFFQYANNNFELLGAFQVLRIFEALNLHLSVFEGLEYIHISISAELECKIQTQDVDGLFIEIKQTIPDIATRLNQII